VARGTPHSSQDDRAQRDLCTGWLGSDSRQLAACGCPGQQENAGEHTSGKTRKGNRWLRTTLNEAALAAIRVKDSRQRRLGIAGSCAPRAQESRCGGRAYDLSHHLSSAQGPCLVYGVGSQVSRGSGPGTRDTRPVKQLERLGHRVILDRSP
jgi:transposase